MLSFSSVKGQTPQNDQVFFWHVKFNCLRTIIVIAIFSKSVSGQSCDIPSDVCGNQYAYCGDGNDYCSSGCQPITNHVRVSSMVTDTFFNGIADQATGNCAGKGFYTRAAFLEALNSYPSFGNVGSVDVSKREIAAFFAHVTDVTDSFCYIEAVNSPFEYCCDKTDKEYPCAPGKSYCGRGPIQLTWNTNYGPAGKSIGFDGLNNPEILAKDRVMSFKSALWFWMNDCHRIITSGQGFGPTIAVVNGSLGCGGANSNTFSPRIEFYINYCKQFGVSPGDNLTC